MSRHLLVIFLALTARAFGPAALAQSDPLPSWNDGAAKARIIAFVQAVTAAGSKDFVAPEQVIGSSVTTPNASSPTTGSRTSAGSTARWTKPALAAGRW